MSQTKPPKKPMLWQEEEEALKKALKDIEEDAPADQDSEDKLIQDLVVESAPVKAKSVDAVTESQQAQEAIPLDVVPQTPPKPKKAPPPAPSRTPQSRPVDAVQTRPVEEVKPIVSTAQPESPAIEEEQPAAQTKKPIAEAGTEVVSIYRLPSHTRFMSNKRIFFYATYLMIIGLILLGVSYYAPQGLIPFVQYPDNPITVNLWRLRRFPFSNVSIPPEGSIVTDPEIGLSGTALPGTDIMVNGEPVQVNPNGSFHVLYSLKPGPNNIEITATLGEKEERVMRQVYYVVTDDEPDEDVANDETDTTVPHNPEETEDDEDNPDSDIPTNTPIEVILTIGDEATWLEVSVDGVDYPRDQLDPGDEVDYEVTDSLSISTGNAGSLLLTVNKNEIGPLGRPNATESRVFSYEDLQEFLLYQ